MKIKQSLVALAVFWGINQTASAWICSDTLANSISLSSTNYSQYESTMAGIDAFGNFLGLVTAQEQTVMTTLDLMSEQLKLQIEAGMENEKNAIKKIKNELITTIKNIGVGQVQSNTAIGSFTEQKDTERKLNEVQEQYTQPATNCMQYSMGKNLFDSSQSSQRIASQTAKSNSLDLLALLDPVHQVLDMLNTNMKMFGNPANPELQNGDVNATFMFGSANGDLTRSSLDEDFAARAFINHIIGKNYAPPSISNQEKTQNGQLYTNLLRRFATYIGLADYSLEMIAQNHQAKPELVDFYETAGLPLSTEKEKNGVSIAEMLEDYSNHFIGEGALTSLATAPNTSTVLRQLNQNTAMRLWVDFNAMKSNERIQAMEAAKLGLLAEKVLGEKSRLYYQSAINNRSSISNN